LEGAVRDGACAASSTRDRPRTQTSREGRRFENDGRAPRIERGRGLNMGRLQAEIDDVIDPGPTSRRWNRELFD